jgi:hypothetical protein
MNSLIYNIPLHLVPHYRDRRVVVRALELNNIAEVLPDSDRENLQFIQLPSAGIEPANLDGFADWGEDVPLDILINDPVQEFPLLYHFSKLLDKHPIRVSIAVKPGFIKAVKLAAALNFAVKLVVGQPDDVLIEEMSQVLDMYLHRSGISQPIEYFHSLFLSSYRQEPTSLWMIQEDDPDHFRFISDEGEETVSPRFAGSDPASRTPSNGSSDCSACEFETRCGGYFKWPDADYNCRGVKILFATIEAAAEELRGDVASMIAVQGGPQPL